MNNHERKERISRIFTMICTGLIILFFFIPYIPVGNDKVSMAGVVIRSILAGGVEKYVPFTAEQLQNQLDSSWKIIFLSLFGYLISGVLFAAYFIGRLLKKAMYKTGAAAHGTNILFALVLLVSSMEARIPVWQVLVPVLLSVIEFGGRKVIEDESESERPKVKDNKPESPLLLKVIVKNWLYNKRAWSLFFVSAVFTAMLTCISIASARMLSGMHSEMSATLNGGIMDIIKMAVVIIAVINLFLMGSALKFYARSRARDYGMFLTLGIGEHTMNLLLTAEYLLSLLVAMILGCIVGIPGTMAVKHLLIRYIGRDVRLGKMNVWTILIILLVCTIIFLSAFLWNKDSITDITVSGSMTANVKAETAPTRWRKRTTVEGIGICAAMLILFSDRRFFESLYLLFLYVGGMYLLYYFGGSLLLVWQKRKPTYFGKMLVLNQFYHRYKSNAVHIFSMFLLDFFLLAYLVPQIIGAAGKADRQESNPYDFVCMFENVDESFIKEVKEQYHAQITLEEMVRITVSDISPKREDPRATNEIPEGQQIGIAQTTYQKLNKKKLSLSGNEIFISYQQTMGENAHPLDFSTLSLVPHMHAGLPVPYEQAYRTLTFKNAYKIKGQERNIFIGHLQQGYQENVVVFSDSYFQSLREEADGPKYLALIKVPKEYRDTVGRQLKVYEKAQRTIDASADGYGYAYDKKISGVYDSQSVRWFLPHGLFNSLNTHQTVKV